MKIPINSKSTNNDVAESIYSLLLDNLKNNNSVNIIIQKEYVDVTFSKSTISKVKVYESKDMTGSDFTLVSMKLKDEFLDKNKLVYFSHMIIEGMFDNYLKFGVTYFFVELEIDEPGTFKMWINKGFSTETMQKYWNTNIDVGWDTKGNFSRREWRSVPTGSGKGGM